MSDAATTAWKNAVVAAGGSVSAGREAAVDAFILGLKFDGIWPKLDRLWLYAAENTHSALIDLVTLDVALPVNDPVFTTDRGYFCDGTAVIDTTYNLLADAVNFTASLEHIAVWNLTDGVSTTPTVTTSVGTSVWHLFAKYSDGNAYFRINDPASAGFAVSDARGFLVGNRSGDYAREAYQNGVSLGTYPSSPAAAVLADENLLISDRHIAAFSVGGSLSPAEQLAYYGRLHSYMGVVGIVPQDAGVTLAGAGQLAANATVLSSLVANARFAGAGSLAANAAVLNLLEAGAQLSVVAQLVADSTILTSSFATAKLAGFGRFVSSATIITATGEVPVHHISSVVAITATPARTADVSLTTGLGPIAVSGDAPAVNARTFSEVLRIGDILYLGIAHRDKNEWEEGAYTYVGVDRFARSQITQSSAGGGPVDFSAGYKDVWATIPSRVIQRIDENVTHTGLAEVDFGVGSPTASVEISDAPIMARSVLSAQVVAVATDDHDVEDHWTDAPIVVAGDIVEGAGFTIFVTARGADLTGRYTVAWMWK